MTDYKAIHQLARRAAYVEILIEHRGDEKGYLAREVLALNHVLDLLLDTDLADLVERARADVASHPPNPPSAPQT